MAKTTRNRRDPWAEGVAHLRGVDARWDVLIGRAGPCLIQPRKDRFGTLVRAIIGQQISSKAATSIDARLRAITGEPHEPGPLTALGETGLRGVGLSGVKARYVLNLAAAVEAGSVPLEKYHRWDDAAVIVNLTAVKGVGVWTAEMFLIFALGRPDVWPVGDLGVRAGLRNLFGLSDLPKPELCRALAEPWRPFRSVASWYLWRSLDPALRAPADAPVTTALAVSPASADPQPADGPA